MYRWWYMYLSEVIFIFVRHVKNCHIIYAQLSLRSDKNCAYLFNWLLSLWMRLVENYQSVGELHFMQWKLQKTGCSVVIAAHILKQLVYLFVYVPCGLIQNEWNYHCLHAVCCLVACRWNAACCDRVSRRERATVLRHTDVSTASIIWLHRHFQATTRLMTYISVLLISTKTLIAWELESCWVKKMSCSQVAKCFARQVYRALRMSPCGIPRCSSGQLVFFDKMEVYT